MVAKKRGLGRGLDALLGGAGGQNRDDSSTPADDTVPAGPVLRNVPVDLIQRGKYQPRNDIAQESLQELADSIKAQGVMQPIVIRPISDQRFEIIAGERRWRAAQLAGLAEIPAQVRDVPDQAAIAMALIENIQREDLNPIEEAAALQRLQAEFQLTQQEIAEAVGKSRSTIANLLRLMTLEPSVRKLLEHGDIDMGHARALLALSNQAQSEAARTVTARSLSVRQTEQLVRQISSAPARKAERGRQLDPDIRRLCDELAEKLGAQVEIKHSASGKGKLVLSYGNLSELDGILAHIK